MQQKRSLLCLCLLLSFSAYLTTYATPELTLIASPPNVVNLADIDSFTHEGLTFTRYNPNSALPSSSFKVVVAINDSISDVNTNGARSFTKDNRTKNLMNMDAVRILAKISAPKIFDHFLNLPYYIHLTRISGEKFIWNWYDPAADEDNPEKSIYLPDTFLTIDVNIAEIYANLDKRCFQIRLNNALLNKNSLKDNSAPPKLLANIDEATPLCLAIFVVTGTLEATR